MQSCFCKDLEFAEWCKSGKDAHEDRRPRLEVLFSLCARLSKLYCSVNPVCPDVNGSWATLLSVFLAVLRREKERGREREGGMFGLDLSCLSRPLGMVCKPALQHYRAPSPSPLPLSYLHIHTNTSSALPLASFIVSVRLEGACCYTITRQSSPWQAARQAGRALRYPPIPQETRPYFRCSTPQLPAPSYTSCSPLALFWERVVCQSQTMPLGRRGILHLRIYYFFFLSSTKTGMGVDY